ncbi:response regulator [Paenibacillus chungangensis]|uniref:Response regulator n=1 Tax=Paenibacillus chungangensis TaxID=696535 RepID=A0ABW3HUQ2_9BACL
MTNKVMLVDDEMLVRLGVKSLIQWEQHGFRFMGDAPDGAKALELMAADGPPDILLTDIVMPNMNGLELIEQVHKLYPSTLIIVLSSHNEFDYVRKAMKLGVEDYLLKTSLKPAELLQLLIESSDKLRRNKKKRLEQNKSVTDADRNSDALTGLLERLLAAEGVEEAGVSREQPASLPMNSYMLLISIRGIREGVPHHSAAQLLKHLVEAELQEILLAGPVLWDKDGIAALVTMPGSDRDKLQARVDHLANASGNLLGISLSGYTSGPVDNWREAGQRLAELKRQERGHAIKEASRDDIKKLLRYMEEHYADNLSLRAAAAMVNMSEAYLSTVFKKETGTTFTDWLNMLRIDKAESLLRESDMPSYLISEQVGYENSNYFGRIFKKMKGVSPQKYRASYGNKKRNTERM